MDSSASCKWSWNPGASPDPQPNLQYTLVIKKHFSILYFHNPKFQPDAPTLMPWLITHFQFLNRFGASVVLLTTNMVLSIKTQVDLEVGRDLTAKPGETTQTH